MPKAFMNEFTQRSSKTHQHIKDSTSHNPSKYKDKPFDHAAEDTPSTLLIFISFLICPMIFCQSPLESSPVHVFIPFHKSHR